MIPNSLPYGRFSPVLDPGRIGARSPLVHAPFRIAWTGAAAGESLGGQFSGAPAREAPAGGRRPSDAYSYLPASFGSIDGSAVVDLDVYTLRHLTRPVPYL
jgi:hypothetical protein